MDYNLQKLITPSIPFFTKRTSYPFFKSDPATIQINPGVGQIVNLHKSYIPLYIPSNSLTIEKIESTEASNLIGSGTVDIEENLAAKSLPSTSATQPDEDSFVENKINDKKRHLDESVYEAFQHPFVKTGRFELPKSNKTKVSSEKHEKGLSHKFHIVKK